MSVGVLVQFGSAGQHACLTVDPGEASVCYARHRGPLLDHMEASVPAPVPSADSRANFNLVSRHTESVCLLTQVEIQGTDLLPGCCLGGTEVMPAGLFGGQDCLFCKEETSVSKMANVGVGSC